MAMSVAISMAMDGPKSPKKATRALAELDSVLSGATTNSNRSWVDSEEMASTDETPEMESHGVDAIETHLSHSAMTKPRASSSSPYQKSTSTLLDNRKSLHKGRRRTHFAGDDVSTCSNTIVSKDVSRDGSVFSMPELISNIELMNDVVQHLTRPVSVSNRSGIYMDHSTPADRFLMEITKDAFAKESSSASVRSSNSVSISMSHASKSSMPSRRSNRRRRKRGASLEREISLCILQTAAGGSDMAHFLVISHECTEVVLSTKSILEDLLASNPSVGKTSARSQLAARGIQFGNIPTLENNRSHSIACIEKKDILSAAASISSDNDRTTSDSHSTISQRDAASVAVASSILLPMESTQQQVKKLHGAGEVDFALRTPTTTSLEIPKYNWTSFDMANSTDSKHNITEFEYHDTNDTCWSVMSPSTEKWPKETSSSTGSVVMDLLEEGIDDDDEPGGDEEPRNIVREVHNSSSTQTDFKDTCNDNDTHPRINEENDATSHVSAAYSVILSLSEHAAIAYNLTPIESSEDVKVPSLFTEQAAQIHSVLPQDTSRLKPNNPSETAKSDADEISVHPIFESSKNGFGGVYAFDMDEDDDWTMFEGSISESPGRKAIDSLADSDMFNVVNTDPDDCVKKMVAQPDSPTSVLNIIGSRRVDI